MSAIIPFFLVVLPVAVRVSSFSLPVTIGRKNIYHVQRGREIKMAYTDEDFDKLVDLMFAPVVLDAVKKAGENKVEEDAGTCQRLAQNVIKGVCSICFRINCSKMLFRPLL